MQVKLYTTICQQLIWAILLGWLTIIWRTLVDVWNHWITMINVKVKFKIISWLFKTKSNSKWRQQYFTSERTHKPSTLRFWVKVWCSNHLYDCSKSNVMIPQTPRNPVVVPEALFNEGFNWLLDSNDFVTKDIQVAGPVIVNSGTSGWKILYLRGSIYP